MKKYALPLLLFVFALFSCSQNPKKENQKEDVLKTVENPTIEYSEKETKERLSKETKIKEKKEVKWYICFTENEKKKLKLWMSFDNDERAIQVKYKGQTKAIDLEFVKKQVQNPGYPATDFYYNEIYQGKINGQYKHTHSGNWDYVEYIRKDGKIFNFTIDHKNERQHSKIPCFSDSENDLSKLSLQTSSKLTLDFEACGKIRFALKKSDLSSFNAIIVSGTNGKAMIMIDNKQILFTNGKEVSGDETLRFYENDELRMNLKFTSKTNNYGTRDHKGSLLVIKKDGSAEVKYDLVGAGGC